jgi:hypothetical protein
MARDLQKGQRELKSSFEILAVSLFISMVASLALFVGSAKRGTTKFSSTYKDPISSEKYPNFSKKYFVHVLDTFERDEPPV